MRFYVSSDPNRCPPGSLPLVPAQNLITGAKQLSRALGALTPLENDLLELASAIYASDLATRRGEREGFTRSIELGVELVHHGLFEQIKDKITTALYQLTDDNWTLSFHPKSGDVEEPTPVPAREGKVLLFSGGLDSLAAAVSELEAGTHLVLASHYTMNRVIRQSQTDLRDYLRHQFNGQFAEVACRSTGQNSGTLSFPADKNRENSQRSRSFLFLTIGAIAARKSGFSDVLMMGENGQMAIHIPLTAARLGAFSTHTAHPEYLSEMSAILSHALSHEIRIENPFLYSTKAECVARLVQAHQTIIEKSVSCWRSSRVVGSHCGTCVPCIIRRISLEHHGLTLSEYNTDLFIQDIAKLPEDDDGKRNLVEVADLVLQFLSGASNESLIAEYPDLVNEHIDANAAVDLYRRFADEAMGVFSNYPGVLACLQ